MSALRGPGEVAEDEAGPALARTYARLREVLGVPFVPTVFRMLGPYERYLTATTDALAELLGGPVGAAFAAEARRQASEATARWPPATLGAGDATGDVAALVERYNTANPRNLLFATALLRERVADAGVMAAPTAPASGSGAAAILADVRAVHGGRVLPGLWRELADLPGVLERAWAAVRQLAGDPAFDEARTMVEGLARTTVAGVATPDPQAHGLAGSDLDAVQDVLAWFSQGIAAMIVEIEYLRRLLAADQ